MKNYIITRGENSDYHICNVTTNYKNTRSDRKKMSKETLGYLTAITLVIIAVIALIAGTVNNFSNDHKYTVTITDKERVTIQSAKGSTGSRYLIYSEDENGKTYVFEDTDTLFRGKFNSSDVYGALKEGETYELTVIGFRVHILGWYENIIDFKVVK